jgi:hypothetical protein
MYPHGVRRQSEAATALWLVYADAPYLMRCRLSVATDPTLTLSLTPRFKRGAKRTVGSLNHFQFPTAFIITVKLSFMRDTLCHFGDKVCHAIQGTMNYFKIFRARIITTRHRFTETPPPPPHLPSPISHLPLPKGN